MTPPAAVGRTAFTLGYAGLLPPAAIVGLLLIGKAQAGGHAWSLIDPLLNVIELVYAGVILSFLGGIWWAFAMRRATRQGALAAIGVLPSLAAWPLVLGGLLETTLLPWATVLMGSVVLLTLLVDRHLVSTGEAPQGWMTLRAPLSLGLGLLTIATGLLGR